MKTSKSPLLIAAAFTGLLGGAMARANAAPNSPQTPGAQSDSTAKPEKHAAPRRQGRLRHRRQSHEKVLSPLL